MIVGTHTILFAEHADQARSFLRDVLGLPHIDAGGGWLIFRSPPGELAVHPAGPSDSGRHELYLVCDNLDSTIAELATKDIHCTPVSEERWGRVTSIRIPGGVTVGLYEPRHPLPLDLPDG